MPTRKPPTAKRSTRKATPPAPPPKRPPGPPTHVPTAADRQTVSIMAAGGIAQEDIARARGLSPKTLRKHYRHELQTGATTLNTVAIIEHVKKIRAGDFQAIKWWQQARMGWSEHIVVEDKPSDTPMRVIVELVGEAAQPRAETSAPRAGSRLPDDVRSSVKLVG